MSVAGTEHDVDAGSIHDQSVSVTDRSEVPKPLARLAMTNEGELDTTQLPRMDGWVYKKGGAVNARGGRRNWKRRWFVLEPIDYRGKTAYELRYYDAPDGNLKGNIGLFDVEIYSEARSRHAIVKYEFQILLPSGGVLQLSCDKKAEREEWLETLNITIAYLRKLTTSSGITLNGYDPIFDDDAEVYEIGEQIAQNSRAFGPGIFGAEAGQKIHFVIQINDINEQPVTQGGMPITVTISNEECLYYVRVLDNNDGTYMAYYTLAKPGYYTLSAKINDEHHIMGSPFQIEIYPSRTVSSCCTAEGDALRSVRPNALNSFAIIARDTFSNRKIKGGDPFEVGILGPATLQSLTDNGDGSYHCTFEMKNTDSSMKFFTSSTLLIMVTLHGKHIAGSPFRPTIQGVLETNENNNFNNTANRNNIGNFRSQDSITSENNSTIKTTAAESTARLSSAPGSVLQHLQRQSKLDTKRSATIISDSMPLPPPPQPPHDQSVERRDTLNSVGSQRSNSVNISPRLDHVQLPNNTNNNGKSSFIQQQSQLQSQTHSQTHSQAPQHMQSVRSNQPITSIQSQQNNANNFRNSVTMPSNNTTNNIVNSTGDTSGGSGGGQTATSTMSKLERARQRAMIVKSLSSSTSNSVIGQPPPTQPQPPLVPPLVPSGPGLTQEDLNDTQKKLSRLEIRTNSVHSGTSGSQPPPPPPPLQPPLVSSSYPTQQPPQPVSQTNRLRPQASPMTPGQVSRVSGSKKLDTPVTAAQVGMIQEISKGLVGNMPLTATSEERRLWELSNAAFVRNPSVISVMVNYANALVSLFQAFSEVVDGVEVVKITNAQNTGFLRMCEEFQIIPDNLSKQEVKSMFTSVLTVQRSLGIPAALVTGGSAIDFTHFCKMLVMMALCAFSKTTALNTKYSTAESKVEAIFAKWNLGDPLKLQVIRSRLKLK